MQSVMIVDALNSTLPVKITDAHCSASVSCHTKGSDSTSDKDSDGGIFYGEPSPTTASIWQNGRVSHLGHGGEPAVTWSLVDSPLPDAITLPYVSKLPISIHLDLAVETNPVNRTPLRSQAAVYVRPADDRTTVMMSNLPISYTSEKLIDLLDSKGYSKQFDFVYLPINFTSGLGQGYAFLNLTTPELAKQFFLEFDGFSEWASFSKKVCAISWSHIQGIEENVSRYRNSPVMGSSVPQWYKPILLEDGVQVAFPGPTQRLRTLRRRKAKDESL